MEPEGQEGEKALAQIIGTAPFTMFSAVQTRVHTPPSTSRLVDAWQVSGNDERSRRFRLPGGKQKRIRPGKGLQAQNSGRWLGLRSPPTELGWGVCTARNWSNAVNLLVQSAVLCEIIE